MKMLKCYDFSCGRDNLSCLVDCNSMLTNILLLKDIHDKINRHENLLDANHDKLIQNLNSDFQNQFLKLCNDYIIQYDKIMGEKPENK